MPVTDSIIKAVDTLSRVKIDSVAVGDSLLRADSIARIDSAKLAASSLPTGMEGVTHPSLPMNEPWVFILLIMLFILLAASIVKSGGELFQNIRSTFKHNYSWGTSGVSTLNNLQSQILAITCSIGVISLFVFELFFEMSGRFDIKTYGKVVGVTLAFYLFKYLILEAVGRVFLNKKAVQNYLSLYFNFLTLFATALFPVLFLYTFQPPTWKLSLELVAAVLFGCFYVLLIIALFQNFYTKKLALFYFFLYLCTLEIIPLFVLFRVYELIV